jgi:COP9 signalosome complex subunit 7
VFVFGELYEVLQEVSPKHKQLLDLFAYGTIADYTRLKSKLPKIGAGAVNKLKMLSLASMCAGARYLRYDDIQRQLDLRSMRELEDLVIQSMYADLLEGRMD